MNETFLVMSEIEDHTRESFGSTIKEFEDLCVVSEAQDPEIDEDKKETQMTHASLKVISDSVEAVAFEVVASEKMIEIGLDDFKMNSFKALVIPIAHQVLDEMPFRDFSISDSRNCWKEFINRTFSRFCLGFYW